MPLSINPYMYQPHSMMTEALCMREDNTGTAARLQQRLALPVALGRPPALQRVLRRAGGRRRRRAARRRRPPRQAGGLLGARQLHGRLQVLQHSLRAAPAQARAPGLLGDPASSTTLAHPRWLLSPSALT